MLYAAHQIIISKRLTK